MDIAQQQFYHQAEMAAAAAAAAQHLRVSFILLLQSPSICTVPDTDGWPIGIRLPGYELNKD